MCENNLVITVTHYFVDQGAWLLFCFIVLPLECRGCARWSVTMPEGVTTAIHIVTLNSSGFWGSLNGKCDLVTVDVHARKELHFIVHKSLSCELKIYHVASCMNHVCCAHYTVISTLCFLGYIITWRWNCLSPVFYQISNVGFRINQYLTNML